MPKNDSQQNDSQQNDSQPATVVNIQEVNDIFEDVKISTNIFKKVALKYGGRVHYAPQHSMIWAGIGTAFRREKWRGVCGDLATEWIKDHVKGGDLVKNIFRLTHVLINGKKYDEKDAAFFRRLHPPPGHTFNLALRKFCSYQHSISFLVSSKEQYNEAFKRGQYQIITFNNHAMASCVYEDGTMSCYDPAIGVAIGLSSAAFFEEYYTMLRILELHSTNITFGLDPYRRSKLLELMLSYERFKVCVRRYVPLINSLRVVNRRTSF